MNEKELKSYKHVIKTNGVCWNYDEVNCRSCINRIPENKVERFNCKLDVELHKRIGEFDVGACTENRIHVAKNTIKLDKLRRLKEL